VAGARKRIKLKVPAEKYPEYNFVGRLLGPRGATLKKLERDTGCKIMIRGKGSIRKDKEADVRGKPGWEHVFHEPLHVVVEVADLADESTAARALIRAKEAVELLLVPVPEEKDSLKRQQLRDLAILNGTFRATDSHHTHPSSLGESSSPPAASPILRSKSAFVTRTSAHVQSSSAVYNNPRSIPMPLPLPRIPSLDIDVDAMADTFLVSPTGVSASHPAASPTIVDETLYAFPSTPCLLSNPALSPLPREQPIPSYNTLSNAHHHHGFSQPRSTYGSPIWSPIPMASASPPMLGLMSSCAPTTGSTYASSLSSVNNIDSCVRNDNGNVTHEHHNRGDYCRHDHTAAAELFQNSLENNDKEYKGCDGGDNDNNNVGNGENDDDNVDNGENDGDNVNNGVHDGDNGVYSNDQSGSLNIISGNNQINRNNSHNGSNISSTNMTSSTNDNVSVSNSSNNNTNASINAGNTTTNSSINRNNISELTSTSSTQLVPSRRSAVTTPLASSISGDNSSHTKLAHHVQSQQRPRNAVPAFAGTPSLDLAGITPASASVCAADVSESVTISAPTSPTELQYLPISGSSTLPSTARSSSDLQEVSQRLQLTRLLPDAETTDEPTADSQTTFTDVYISFPPKTVS
jgi:KH domain